MKAPNMRRIVTAAVAVTIGAVAVGQAPAQARVKHILNSHAATCMGIQDQMDALFDKFWRNKEVTDADLQAARNLMYQWRDDSATQSCEQAYGSIFARQLEPGGEYDNRDSNWAGYVARAETIGGGDFNGDGKRDLVALGSTVDGVKALPVAFSNGDGSFTVTSNPGLGTVEPGPYFGPLAWFLHWSTDPLKPVGTPSRVKKVIGDFNNDGKDDFALVGGTGWGTLPVMFSQGLHPDGYLDMSLTNIPISSSFASWANDPGARAVVGNFDGVGGDDIALVGGASWGSIPVAHSNGDGSFTVATYVPKTGSDTNCQTPAPVQAYCPQFLTWANVNAQNPVVDSVVADFNGDGKDDIALVGGTGWSTVPIAYANSGTMNQAVPVGFTVRDEPASWFAQRMRDQAAPLNEPRTALISAFDLNSDGKDDLTAFGTHDSFGRPDSCLPEATSVMTGSITLRKHSFQQSFPCNTMLLLASVLLLNRDNRLVAGDFNGDGRDDVAVTGRMNFVAMLVARADGGYDYVDRFIA